MHVYYALSALKTYRTRFDRNSLKFLIFHISFYKVEFYNCRMKAEPQTFGTGLFLSQEEYDSLPENDTFRILMATDIHLGHKESDPVRFRVWNQTRLVEDLQFCMLH